MENFCYNEPNPNNNVDHPDNCKVHSIKVTDTKLDTFTT